MENINDSGKEDIISDSPKDSLGQEEIPPDTDINAQNKIYSPSNDNNIIESEQNQEEEKVTFKSPVYQIIQDNHEPQNYQYQNIVELRYQSEKSGILSQDIDKAESLIPKGNEFPKEFYQENTSQIKGVEYNLDFRKNIYPATQEIKSKKNKILKITRTSPVDQHRNRLKENNRNYIIKTNKIKIKTRNKEPKDSKSKIIICSSAKNSQDKTSFIANYHNSINSEISRRTCFGDSPINKIRKKQNNINIQNGKYTRELFRVPMDKYSFRYASNKNVNGGNGMKTGEYKFIGQINSITPKYNPAIKYSFSKEDILSEINKRYKVNTNARKKLKYEVLDKFYVLTELSRERKKIKTQDKIECKIIKVQKHKIYNQNSNKNNEFIAFQQKNKIKNNYKMDDNYKTIVNYSRYTNNISHHNNLNLNFSCSAIYPIDNYSRYLLEQINKTRIDPQSFIGVIEDSKDNIIKDRYGRIIYKGKMKIALSKGESAFNEAIDFLKGASPMKRLEFNNLITVRLPKNENEIIDKNDLGKKVVSMIDNGIIIKSYWRDIIRDPETSFLLMIVDDIGFKSGMRRKDILNPNMKYIGIASTEINGHFVCYITLS